MLRHLVKRLLLVLAILLPSLLFSFSIYSYPLKADSGIRHQNIPHNFEEAAPVVHLFWQAGGVDTHDMGAFAISPSIENDLSFAEGSEAQLALLFVQEYGEVMGVMGDSNIGWEISRSQIETDGFSTVTLQQVFDGLPVFAGQLAVHMQDATEVVGANGEYVAEFDVDTSPRLTEKMALETAVAHLRLDPVKVVSTQLTIFNPALIKNTQSHNHLAYQFQLRSRDQKEFYEIFVDAHTGKVLLSYDLLHHGLNREIYNYETYGQCYGESGPIGSPTSDCEDAFNFTGDTYNYFFDNFARDSFDDAGATMMAYVELYGQNAYWDGYATYFGMGFETKDVVAHEWTHAVIEYTANLTYFGQSGALNESMADVFGTMVERENWLMGEDTPIGAIRSLADPTLYDHPGKTSDGQFYCGTFDNGGVHINSGVPNHAAYLMSEGGDYNGYSIVGVGRAVTEQLFYRALTHYLTNGSDFVDATNALNSSCNDLYGSGSPICGTVSDSLLAVEMMEPVCFIAPDEYEDDDTFEQASVITVDGTAQLHNFHDMNDEDWIRFTAVADKAYDIETVILGENNDTIIYLYDEDLNFIAFDDDDGVGLASRIFEIIPNSGDYYIHIASYGGYFFGAGTEYEVVVREVDLGSGEPDEFEPDDANIEATPIELDEIQTHNSHDIGDQDWVQFDAVANAIYEISTFNLGFYSDTDLYIYDSDLNVLDYDLYSGENGSFLSWVAPEEGSYYVEVIQSDRFTYGVGTQYDIQIAEVGILEVDEYEPDDFYSDASIMPTDGVQTHNFHDYYDIDWVKFSAVAGQTFVIETSNLGSNNDTGMELYDPLLNFIAYDDDSGDGFGSKLLHTPSVTGDYYVVIWNYAGTFGEGTEYDVSLSTFSNQIYFPLVTNN